MKKKIKNIILSSTILLSSLVMPLSLLSCNNSNLNESNPSLEILNGESLTLKVGETIQIDVKLNNLTSSLTYESLNTDVAVISKTGLVTALNEGEALIKVNADNLSDTIKIIVNKEEETLPTLEILDESPINLVIGDSYLLNFKVTNFNDLVSVNLSSLDIIEVSDLTKDSLIIKAKKEGQVKLTLSINESIKESIEINVKKEEIKDFRISLNKNEVKVGETLDINIEIDPIKYLDDVELFILEGSSLIDVNKHQLITKKSGEVKLEAHIDNLVSNVITFKIYDFNISLNSTLIKGNKEKVTISNYLGNQENNLLSQVSNENIVSFSYNSQGELYINPLNVGTTSFYLYDLEGYISNTIDIEVIDKNIYENMTEEEFYSNYTRSNSYIDAMNRSEYNFMSGDIITPDQAPTISSYLPSQNNKLIHNSSTLFSNDNKTYTVVDSNGEKAFDVYYGAAYITLEEVAAYVYAFNEPPINYASSKKLSPTKSPWGEYLRVNISKFSGDTTNYPYEPELPNISGCGGNLTYYEIDIGTTGTDCDPSYVAKIYNDGNKITRGAARIVYSRYYENNGQEVSFDDRYVFYTYNHYNDFQEYLNYYNGWGEMFGNITGGGELSSKDKSKCNPTPYVETIRQSIV